jgi:hypothetical protein
MARGYQHDEHLDPLVASEDREFQAAQPSRSDEPHDQAPRHASLSTDREPDRNTARNVRARALYQLRGRTYRLRVSEIATMLEFGKFRAVAKEDLAQFVYRGDNDRMKLEVENLFRQGLVEIKSIPHEESGSRQLLTLTANGQRFLAETRSTPEGQTLYHGFTKPREAHHDADLYRLYQKASEKIERQGGRNLRVVLDYEIKKRVYRDLARLENDRSSPDNKRVIAERHGLHVVRDKIPVPDIRVE